MNPALLAPAQRARVEKRFGGAGQDWLEWLEQELPEQARAWGVTALKPLLPGGHSGVVFTGLCGGKPAVLKALYELADAEREIAILTYWKNRGVTAIPDLYEAAPAKGMLLLERLSPATSLAEEPDSPALDVELANLFTALHLPIAVGEFPSVAEWFHRWVVGGDYSYLLATGLLDNMAIARVLARGEELLTDSVALVTVHGDIHADNVLRDSRHGLVAVDPYGYAADAAFDVAVWAGKRGDEAQIGGRSARLGRLLGLDPERVQAWTQVLALDSAKMYAQIDAAHPERVIALCRYLNAS
jgi:streptomycin 6-kinase